LSPRIVRGPVGLDQDEPEQCPWRWISTEAVSQMQSVVCSSTDATGENSAACPTDADFWTRVSTPLVSKGRAVGAMTLQANHAGAIQRSGLELLTAIGQQIGMAVEHAHLRKQLEWAAALEERQRIAADMHDGLGQTLSLLGLRVDRAAELVDERVNVDAVQELHRVREVIGQASNEVRQSIASLQQDPQPRRSLQGLLSDLVGQLASQNDPLVQLAIQVQPPIFVAPDQREQILPIIQEAVLNAQRHAQAKRIVVTLSGQGLDISLTIQDDGQGFDPSVQREHTEDHFGLSIMRARAARIGARLHIHSAPGRGTRVILTWTLHAGQVQAHREMPVAFPAAQALSPQGARQ
jgi:two-component system nitrate/nitrite sensor histidine kinase NarX